MVQNPKRHGIYQRMLQIQDIDGVPNLSRAEHFLNGEMARADRLARQIKDLKPSDEKLAKRMADHSHRMEKLRSTLEHFYELRGNDRPLALSLIDRSASYERKGVQ
jgi:hypothetical protein